MVGGNYPDDYQPWLPGGPDWEPWKGRTCGECENARELCDTDGKPMSFRVCTNYDGRGDFQLVRADQPALECFEG